MNSTIAVVLLAVIAFLLYRLFENQASVPQARPTESVLSDGSEFIVEQGSDSKYPQHASITLDVDMHWHRLINHFRLNSRFDIHFGKRLYEYRIDGTDVQVRLIEDEFEDPGSPTRQDVRDGVVQESAIRDFYKDKTWSWLDVDQKITDLKRETEWRPLSSQKFAQARCAKISAKRT